MQARLEQARASVGRSRPGRDDASTLRDEVVFSIDLVALLQRDAQARLEGDGSLASVPQAGRDRLRSELDALVERYRSLWLANNRPGGLEDSVTWLENLREAYASGRPDPEWGGITVPSDS